MADIKSYVEDINDATVGGYQLDCALQNPGDTQAPLSPPSYINTQFKLDIKAFFLSVLKNIAQTMHNDTRYNKF